MTRHKPRRSGIRQRSQAHDGKLYSKSLLPLDLVQASQIQARLTEWRTSRPRSAPRLGGTVMYMVQVLVSTPRRCRVRFSKPLYPRGWSDGSESGVMDRHGSCSYVLYMYARQGRKEREWSSSLFEPHTPALHLVLCRCDLCSHTIVHIRPSTIMPCFMDDCATGYVCIRIRRRSCLMRGREPKAAPQVDGA